MLFKLGSNGIRGGGVLQTGGGRFLVGQLILNLLQTLETAEDSSASVLSFCERVFQVAGKLIPQLVGHSPFLNEFGLEVEDLKI